MKNLFILLFVSLAIISFGQNRYKAEKTTIDLTDTLVYLRSNMELVQGIIYSKHENGQLKYEYNYKDGKLEGIARYWYENGKLRYEQNNKEGKLDGICKDWYESGQLSFECNFKEGKRDGIARKWKVKI